METHKLAGGDVDLTLSAYILAYHGGIDTDFPELANINLGGGDRNALLRQAVEENDPKYIEQALSYLN